MPKTILFMDNNLDFLDVHTKLLRQNDYDVIQATSIEEAREKLDRCHVHAAIFDIRMEDDDDPQDISGLTLAQEATYQPVPKIILTAVTSLDYVRAALGLSTEGQPIAFNFIDKDEGPNKILQAVDQLFADQVRINWGLNILWRNQMSPSQLVSLIIAKDDDVPVLNYADELEDLFRQLFHDCNQITVKRILTHRTGRVALTVFTFSEKGDRNQFIVVCGRRSIIQTEEKTYAEFAPKVIGGGGTIRLNSSQTIHFASTVYGITRGNLEAITPFSEFYNRNPTEKVVAALNHLFCTTLGMWYEQVGYTREDKMLKPFLQDQFGLLESKPTLDDLMQKLNDIRRDGLSAGFRELEYVSPQLTARLAETEAVTDAVVRFGTTPGDLNGNNILVDPAGHTWLIDFSRVSYGPLMRDFLSLETTVKSELLEILDTSERYKLEDALLSIARLDETIEVETSNPELRKALETVFCIRQHATKVIGPEVKPYWAGLYFYALGRLSSYDRSMWYTQAELMPYFHNFISATLLYQKLTPSPPKNLPSQALESLWIEETNKEVWVEGQSVSLSPQEYDLLLYLYHRQGQLCSRAEIAEEVFAGEFKEDLSEADKKTIEEGRINSTMSRLRRKLEPNPDHPQYIISVRGEGYRLVL